MRLIERAAFDSTHPKGHCFHEFGWRGVFWVFDEDFFFPGPPLSFQ